jgi:N-acetylgalactosamine-N,N'-diacetylbacillosaminyl-diphospho-undecaprenol 4-alpha-N-acetylgalactosaminyltransferase
LKKYLNENKFDFIIDFRFRINPIQELLISKWLYKSKTIFTVHSFLINHYMPNWSFLTRFMYQDCYKMVVITNKAKELIEFKHHLNNVQTIYNPINIEEIQFKYNESIDLNFENVIGIGQMESNIKQFDKLIEAYSNSILPNQNIHLVLLGDGERISILKALAKQKKSEKKYIFWTTKTIHISTCEMLNFLF